MTDPENEGRRFWLARKATELRALLQRLPADRRRAFSDMLEAYSSPQSGDSEPGSHLVCADMTVRIRELNRVVSVDSPDRQRIH